LTHGGFYAHFASREAMLAEAADRAGAESVATLTRVAAAAPPQEALPAMIRAYLSKEHVDGVETGCPVAALGSETPRQAPKVRRAATRRIKEMIDVVARHSPDQGAPGAYKRALVTVATMVGALVLARAGRDRPAAVGGSPRPPREQRGLQRCPRGSGRKLDRTGARDLRDELLRDRPDDARRPAPHATPREWSHHQHRLRAGLLAGAIHGSLCRHQARGRRLFGITRS